MLSSFPGFGLSSADFSRQVVVGLTVSEVGWSELVKLSRVLTGWIPSILQTPGARFQRPDHEPNGRTNG